MSLYRVWHIGKDITIGIWKLVENTSTLKNSLKNTNVDFPNFKSTKRLNEYLATRCLLKKLLYTTKIEYLKNGKPILTEFPETEISISHSGNFIVIAISKIYILGIDIEKISNKPLKVLSKFLTKQEAKQINNSSLKASILWAAKEAMFKLNEVDLKNYANQFSVQIQENKIICYIEKKEQLSKYLIVGNFILFLVYKSK